MSLDFNLKPPAYSKKIIVFGVTNQGIVFFGRTTALWRRAIRTS
jgi:hypothetical protein